MIVKRLNLFLECTLAVFILIGFLIQPVTAEEQKFQEEIVPFLKQYCMEGHDESTSKAGFRSKGSIHGSPVVRTSKNGELF